ncbi:hypothetical protein IGI04_026022 [Brassica rapa subsp. trilocularis]|uniref:Uncharacterized protein n=1 Tax=Brassica rapa subsp. trilocularis TaxID=1813537 RepID=A0ABQ7KUS4_BRACM|nr:hypothetical protein IGI04_026022 [Brassica rapa subsp. trilocularis]
MIEPELVGRKEHTSGASHLAVPENLRPPLCKEEAVGICKRVKRIHDPVKIMVPCAVFEVESPIPPDKGVYLSSYIEVLNDQHHVEAYQRGLRFRDEEDNCPAEVPSSNINKTKLIDTNTSSSIDTDQIPSIDTRRESEQNEHELCGNIFYGDTTTHSDKSGGTKWRNWKKKKRINECSQISLIPHFSDDTRKSRVRLHKSVRKNGRNWKKQKRTKGGSQLPLTPYFSDSIRKSRVRSKCFSHPYAKLKALLIAEMIDKGEGSHSYADLIRSPEVQGKDPRKTSFHRNRRWLASIDRQSIKSIDRHLTVLLDTHIQADQSRRLLSTSTDDTSSISIDSASYPTIDCLFIVSNHCSSHRPMRPCHINRQHFINIDRLSIHCIVLKILKWINMSTMFTLAEIDFLDVDCNIVEVMILSFKSCELLFSKPLSERLPSVLLEDKQKGSGTFRRNMVILESFGAFGGVELHRRVRCLSMDGDLKTVNQHPVAEVMPVLLKSGQSASREEAAEKRKPRRSMQHSARRSVEIPDHPPVRFRVQIGLWD